MKTTIENLEFPSDIKKRLKMKVSTTNLNIEFLSGHIIKFNQTNISVREPHRIIVSNSKNTLIALLYDDIPIKNMNKQYAYLKEHADQSRERLERVNSQTKETLSKSNEVKEIITNLKLTKISKNNYVISEEDKKIIYDFAKKVDINVDGIKNIDDLTSLMDDFENNIQNYTNSIDNLELELKQKNQRIKTLERQNITKQNKIAEQREENSLLKEENSKLKELLKAWQEFWKKILEFLQDKFFSSKKEDKIYEQVMDELLDRNILNKDDIGEIQNGYYSNEKDNDGLEL